MSGGRDPLRQALGEWWAAQGFPPVDRLTDDQALRTLDEIERMEWSCRPFGDDDPNAPPRSAVT